MTLPIRSVVPPFDAVRDFARDVRRDLALSPKQLQSKYLYNDLGSSLFEAICCLPWYRITRAEGRLLTRFADEMVASLGDPITLVELGSGSGEKIAMIAEALLRKQRAVSVHLIDISPAALESSAKTLGRLGPVSVVGHRTTYEEGLRRVAAQRRDGSTILALCLGSNIGNFERAAAQDFMRQIRAALEPDDALLLGADLLKPERELLLAYDDPLGVTAAFNKNLLLRMNIELLANFDLGAFSHRAVWNSAEHRIEMHLVSSKRQRVEIVRAEMRVDFEAGEHIWTESSHKYTPLELERFGITAGFQSREQWLDADARFALTLFRAL